MTAIRETTMAETGKIRRPMSRRRKRYWTSLGAAALIGGVIGGWMVADQRNEPYSIATLFSGALTPDFAIGASAAWVIGLAVCMILYHRAIDDHEEHAWLWASTAGWYAFIFPAPVWWVLHRAGMAPPADAMILFLLSLVVNAIVYLWLKFR